MGVDIVDEQVLQELAGHEWGFEQLASSPLPVRPLHRAAATASAEDVWVFHCDTLEYLPSFRLQHLRSGHLIFATIPDVLVNFFAS